MGGGEQDSLPAGGRFPWGALKKVQGVPLSGKFRGRPILESSEGAPRKVQGAQPPRKFRGRPLWKVQGAPPSGKFRGRPPHRLLRRGQETCAPLNSEHASEMDFIFKLLLVCFYSIKLPVSFSMETAGHRYRVHCTL